MHATALPFTPLMIRTDRSTRAVVVSEEVVEKEKEKFVPKEMNFDFLSPYEEVSHLIRRHNFEFTFYIKKHCATIYLKKRLFDR